MDRRSNVETDDLDKSSEGLGRLKLAERQHMSHVTRTPVSRSKGPSLQGRGYIVEVSRALVSLRGRDIVVFFLEQNGIKFHP